MVGRGILSSSWGVSDLGLPEMATGLALVIFVVLIAKLALRTYRIHMHPLNSFKGLPDAFVSENWLYKVTKSGRAEQTFESLHEKYSMYSDDIFRIGKDCDFAQLLIFYLQHRHEGSSDWT